LRPAQHLSLFPKGFHCDTASQQNCFARLFDNL